MKFKIDEGSVIMKNHFDNPIEAVKMLNEYFLGWIFLQGEGKNNNGVYHVTEYYTKHGDINFKSDKIGNHIQLEDIQNNEDIKLQNRSDDSDIYKTDIIYKLKEYDEDDKFEPRIRWWKDGKFENLKTFNDYNEGVKWYSKGKLTEDPEYSKIDVPEYDDFIKDNKFRQFLIDNNAYDEFIKFAKQTFRRSNGINHRDNIDSALRWSTTRSGSDFWGKLNYKWRNICDDSNEGVKWYSKGKLIEDPDYVETEYDDFITDNKFRRFLIYNAVYDEFIEHALVSFKKWNIINQLDAIDSALNWHDMPSGFIIWKDLNKKWNDICRNSNEGVKWYSKGKLTEDPEYSNIDVPEYNDFIKDDKFRQFLIDNKAYDEFIEYSSKSFKRNNGFKQRNCIDYALTWSETTSGSQYWYRLNDKWNDICDDSNEGVKWYSKGKLTEDPDYDDSASEYTGFYKR